MQSYVVGFMFDLGKSTVALVQKNRPQWQAGYLNGIGGKIEPGETPAEAMRREFREETGLDWEIWAPFVRLYREGVYDIYVFVAETDEVNRVQSTTDEPIGLFSTRFIHSYACVDNLYWLLPMAMDPCVGKGEFIPIKDTRSPEEAN